MKPRRESEGETTKSPKKSDPDEPRPEGTAKSRMGGVALLVSPDQNGDH